MGCFPSQVERGREEGWQCLRAPPENEETSLYSPYSPQPVLGVQPPALPALTWGGETPAGASLGPAGTQKLPGWRRSSGGRDGHERLPHLGFLAPHLLPAAHPFCPEGGPALPGAGPKQSTAVRPQGPQAESTALRGPLQRQISFPGSTAVKRRGGGSYVMCTLVHSVYFFPRLSGLEPWAVGRGRPIGEGSWHRSGSPWEAGLWHLLYPRACASRSGPGLFY